MTEIIKAYRQSVPALRFIGKKYGDSDRVNGGFGKQWGDWFEQGLFGIIEAKIKGSLKTVYEDGDAYIGLMRWKDGEPFEYWIGILRRRAQKFPRGLTIETFPPPTLAFAGFTEMTFTVKRTSAQSVFPPKGIKLFPTARELTGFLSVTAARVSLPPTKKDSEYLTFATISNKNKYNIKTPTFVGV